MNVAHMQPTYGHPDLKGSEYYLFVFIVLLCPQAVYQISI